MKHFIRGLLKYDCSKAMRRGKRIKVYNPDNLKRCPNCRQWLAVWIPKRTIIMLLLIVFAGGCTAKRYSQREWDAGGNLVAKVDVCLVSVLTKTQAKDIFVLTKGKMMFVGDFSQSPDVQAHAAAKPPTLAELNKQIKLADIDSQIQQAKTRQEKLKYLRKQTVTVGELLDRWGVERKRDMEDHYITPHYSDPGYYIKKYAEEIILERESK